MRLSPSNRRIVTLTATLFTILAVGWGAAGAAMAGPLRASASLTTDPAGVVNDTADSGSAFAAYPGSANPAATATATRRHLLVDTGPSGSFVDKYGAAADVRTTYALWNLAENRALTAEEAAAITLSFHFNLSGVSATFGDAHERAVGLSGSLTYNAFPFAVSFGDNGSVTQDSLGRVANGNSALMAGVVDEDYALEHRGAAGGEVAFSLFANTALGATANYDLWLESVTLVEELAASSARAGAFAASGLSAGASSFSLANGLGVKLLDDIGDIIVVVAAEDSGPHGVPTAPTWTLALGALALMRAGRPRANSRGPGR